MCSQLSNSYLHFTKSLSRQHKFILQICPRAHVLFIIVSGRGLSKERLSSLLKENINAGPKEGYLGMGWDYLIRMRKWGPGSLRGTLINQEYQEKESKCLRPFTFLFICFLRIEWQEGQKKHQLTWAMAVSIAGEDQSSLGLFSWKRIVFWEDRKEEAWECSGSHTGFTTLTDQVHYLYLPGPGNSG